MPPPNVLYLHSHDTGRYVQPYGWPVPTPNIQRMADQGLLFRQGFCVVPTCSGSRACLLTGQYGHSNGMLGLAHRGWELNDYTQHIVHTLRRAGYFSLLLTITPAILRVIVWGVTAVNAAVADPPADDATVIVGGGAATFVNGVPVSGPKPGSASSWGAIPATSWAISRWSALIVRVSSQMRRSSSRAIRTRIVCCAREAAGDAGRPAAVKQ